MDTDQRDRVIAEAVRHRKIRQDQTDTYRRMWDANPSAIRHLLTASVAEGGFMPGLVAGQSGAPDEYPREWLGPANHGTAVVMGDDGPHTLADPPAAPDRPSPVVMFES